MQITGLDHVQVAAPVGCEVVVVFGSPADRTSSTSASRRTSCPRPRRWDDEIPGRRRFYAADPWGNRIELIAAE